jgi:hypothetical protein
VWKSDEIWLSWMIWLNKDDEQELYQIILYRISTAFLESVFNNLRDWIPNRPGSGLIPLVVGIILPCPNGKTEKSTGQLWFTFPLDYCNLGGKSTPCQTHKNKINCQLAGYIISHDMYHLYIIYLYHYIHIKWYPIVLGPMPHLYIYVVFICFSSNGGSQ